MDSKKLWVLTGLNYLPLVFTAPVHPAPPALIHPCTSISGVPFTRGGCSSGSCDSYHLFASLINIIELFYFE